MSEKRRKLRVLFIPYWYPPRKGQNRVDGTFNREHALAAAIHDDVRVLVFRRNSKVSTVKMQIYNDENVPTYDISYPWTGRSPIHFARRRLLWMKSLRTALRGWGRPDLFHFQDMSSFYGGVTAKLMGVPYVVSQHWTGFMKGLVKPCDLNRFHRSLKDAQLVLAASLEAPEYLASYGIQAKVEWFPNTYDPSVFWPGGDDCRERRLLHVSEPTDQKRVPDIIQAFRRVVADFPEASIRFVGDGDNRNRLEAMAAEILPDGSFDFTGFMDKVNVAEEMRNCAGFVFPSSAETFGCVLMEAMACGCPVLTTRVGGIPAVVRDGEGIFVEVGNIDAIAEGMKTLLSGDHSLPLQTIAEEVRNRFSRNVVGKMLHSAYRRALGISEDNHREQ